MPESKKRKKKKNPNLKVVPNKKRPPATQPQEETIAQKYGKAFRHLVQEMLKYLDSETPSQGAKTRVDQAAAKVDEEFSKREGQG